MVRKLVFISCLLIATPVWAQPPTCPTAPASIPQVNTGQTFRVGGCVDKRDATTGAPANVTAVNLYINNTLDRTIPSSAFVSSSDSNFDYWEVSMVIKTAGPVTFEHSAVNAQGESPRGPFPPFSVLSPPGPPRVPVGSRILP
jgi:hypothetical protein